MANKSSLPDGFDNLLTDLYFRLEERDHWADHLIRFLLAANGGGIAIVMAYTGVLTNAGRPVGGLALGLLAFSSGLLLVGIQLFYSAYSVRKGRRELRRLMVEVLDGTRDYASTFREMGNPDRFPSKWPIYYGLTMFSFLCVFAGVLFSFLGIR